MAQSTVDIRDVLGGIRVLDKRASADADIYFRELAPDMRAHVRSHRQGPDGAWKKRGSRKRGAGGRFVRAGRKLSGRPMGKLRTANRAKADQSGVRIISDVDWSAAHEDGDVVGHGAKLPARPIYWLSEGFTQKSADGFATFVWKGWTR